MLRAVIPRFSDNLSAGFPSAAEGYEDEPLDLHRWLVRNPVATFFYRVRGDDFANEQLRDGSILVVDRSIRPTPGKLVIIEADGQFLIVRYRAGARVLVCGVVTAAVTRM